MQRRYSVRGLLAAAALFLASLSVPAFADAIDGDWCYGSQSLRIEGPSIRTPGGTQMQGNYSRHGFSYVVPPSEPEAGTEIVMRLHGEELMTLARTSSAKPEESWRRCKPIS